MEVIGLAASIITLINSAALTSSTLTRLWRLRGCPHYILSALNEIEDFRATLTLVQSAKDWIQVPEDVLAEISRLLARAEDQLRRFDQYLNDNVVQPHDDDRADAPVRLRGRAKLKEAMGLAREHFDDFQQGLQAIKSNLVIALQVANIRNTSGLFTVIQQISIINNVNDMSTVNIGEDVAVASNMERALVTGTSSTSGASQHSICNLSALRPSSQIEIETKSLAYVCHPRCPCQCHIPLQGTTPRWLQGLVGVMFARFTGTPLLNYRSCNFTACSRDPREQGSLRYSYRFPAWLLQAGFEVTASWGSLSGLEGTCRLRTPWTIDDNIVYSMIWYAVRDSSLDEVRRIMHEHGVRHYDRFRFGSRSILNLAVKFHREDVCKFLLKDGVDVHYREYGGYSDAEYLWLMHLQFDIFKDLQRHPELEDLSEGLSPTTVFASISNDNLASLCRELELDPMFCLRRDRFGATMLHWAACLADKAAIAVLLTAGADVHASSLDGSSVLMWAVRSSSAPCCRAILQAGADVHHRNKAGVTALMLSLSHTLANEDVIRLLLESGSEVQVAHPDSGSVLSMAIQNASTNICREMFHRGAGVDDFSDTGWTSIHAAIECNRHSMLQFLIERRASLTCMDRAGHSIIHWAASFGDIETMKILENAHIHDLKMDPDSVEVYWRLFNHRHNTFSGELASNVDETAAFQALLRSIVPSTLPPGSSVAAELVVPGAFPVEPKLGEEADEHHDALSQSDRTTEGERETDLLGSFKFPRLPSQLGCREIKGARSRSI